MASDSLKNLKWLYIYALMPLGLFQGIFQQIDPIKANSFPKIHVRRSKCLLSVKISF